MEFIKHKLAQNEYESRLLKKQKFVKLTPIICRDIRAMIKKDFSPEQVAGTMKKRGSITISHETIYQFIWKDKKQKGNLFTHLRHQGRRYRKRGSSKDSRGQIIGRVGIEKRPKEANELKVFGHLEVDTIIGKNHICAIITLNDKASGMLYMRKVEKRDAKEVRKKLSKMLDEIKPYLKTITADNGKEFSEHKRISEEYCDFYFANPYSPWERGSNENLNSLVRQYIPKSSDLSLISEKRIAYVQNKLNERPRKRFNYENPIFVMEKLLSNSEVAFVP